jgi:phage terminase large subunit-like protein
VSMNSPTKRVVLVPSGQLAHSGNPVLQWMDSNVSLETDAANSWKPSKKRSRERIDGIVATIRGLGLAQDNPDTEATPWGFYIG